ncbi:MAG: response regulator [Trueperaceae bacterium]|nr:response regulator [Trueperaceae bacterium]
MSPLPPAKDAVILIVDDSLANVELFTRLLRGSGYSNLYATTEPEEALDLYAAYAPDLLILDLMMPRVTGFDILEQLGTIVDDDDYRPVLVITALSDTESKRKALALGAHDFVHKPFDLQELRLRIDNLLKTRSLHLRYRHLNATLEHEVAKRTADLLAAQNEVLTRLGWAADYRDDTTGQHTVRVGKRSAKVAAELGLAPQRVAAIHRAARLHDLGKIGIPDSILLKKGPLSTEEYEVMKSHTIIGAKLLSRSRSKLLELSKTIALTHHEAFDGSGYPRGIAGDAIPLEGRIVAVVDVFDALTTVRPYKAAWPCSDAVDELRRLSGSKFDPEVVEAFLRIIAAEQAEVVPHADRKQRSLGSAPDDDPTA